MVDGPQKIEPAAAEFLPSSHSKSASIRIERPASPDRSTGSGGAPRGTFRGGC